MGRRNTSEPLGYKVLTTWKIWREAEKRDVEVTVRISAGKGVVTFSADAKLAGDVRISEHNTDLYALQREVTAKVADSVALTWRSMLLVTARHQHIQRMDENDDSAGVLVSYEPVELAQAGKDRFRRRPGAQNIEKGWPLTGELGRGWSDGDDRSVSLIPDTPDNRTAIASIVDGLKTISERIRGLMKPESIEATLAAAAAGLPLIADQRAEK